MKENSKGNAISRRTFFKRAAIVGAAGIAASIPGAGLAAKTNKKIEPAKPIEKFPDFKFKENKKFKILQFTDTHYIAGDPRSERAMKNVIEMLDTEKPDLVIHTGDVIFGEHWAAAAGIRANYYDGYYRGYVKAAMNSVDKVLADYQIDCDQTGWGFNPILSVDYHNKNLTLTAKYEFRAKLDIPNKTNLNTVPESMGSAFRDGAKTRYDMPALLSIAAGYEFTPKLRATLEYHFFDDKNAKMASDRQKELTHGTDEYLIGAEYDINKTFTVSAGAQRTDYGLSDAYEANTSFACDSYSIGAGGAVNVNAHLRVNVGYFVTLYSDYTKHTNAGTPGYCNTTLEGTDVYSRTNGVFGIGVDYKF
jgi:long-chain fatty acid transport protein